MSRAHFPPTSLKEQVVVYLTPSLCAWRRVAAVLAATFLVWSVLGLSPQRAGAGGGSFSGYAEARGLYVSVINASIPA